MSPVLWIRLALIVILFLNYGITQDLSNTVHQYWSIDNQPKESILLKNGVDYVVHFSKSNSPNPFRFTVYSRSSSEKYPVLVVVKQEKDVMSWNVPVVLETFKGKTKYYYRTSRTVCHNDMFQINQISLQTIKNYKLLFDFSQSFMVYLSTSSPVPISVDLEAIEETEFFIRENLTYSLTISPAEPRYIYYKFEDNSTDTIIVETTSKDDICITVSIQESNCPVMDLNRDITYEGRYLTISRQGAVIIQRKDYPKGFFLVYVAHPDNYQCSQEHSILPDLRSYGSTDGNNVTVETFDHSRSTTVDFVIRRNINKQGYYNASYITLGAIGIFYVISILMVFVFKRWGSLRNVKTTGDELLNDSSDNHNLRSSTPTRISYILKSSQLSVKSLTQNPIKAKTRSFNYLWHILSIAIFYSIPVVQLVITYQRVVNQTGNQDMCYYNFKCAHPALGFSDFNHIFSNIGYILIGILFSFVTVYRHATVPFRLDVGIPVHYGLFYAMGIAMIIEGLLSACYHICPSQSNYQFDTSFMYVMAVLCMVKLYQNRHADINATAYATFTVLGLATFLAMLGILNGSLIVWIIFVLCYTVMCIYISIKIYFLSYILDGLKKMKNDFQDTGFETTTFKPVRKGSFVLLLLANVCNLAMLVGGVVMYTLNITDFGTFLLALLMGNSILYAVFYTSMKLIHKERICFEAICYGILAIACWAAAAYFFMDPATLWTVTPAESRLSNQKCIVMHFYDKHDIWHLLSAPALYLTFMFLMCLDDDLINTKQEDMSVF